MAMPLMGIRPTAEPWTSWAEMEKAVALQYEPSLPAPMIVARGKGELARRIREIAAANGITLVREPEVAGALVELDVGAFVPEEFYEIIAKLLVFVTQVEGR
jgi:flagellar biosynthetic protein FlhB